MAILDYPATSINIKSAPYNAKGDGVTDDTAAFLKAIQDTQNGEIYIPGGTYVITRVLQIRKSNVVIRGESKEKTTLYFPDPLKVMANRESPALLPPQGDFGYSGGSVWIEGNDDKGSKVGDITADADRGSSSLTLSSVAGLTKGMYVMLVESEVISKVDDQGNLIDPQGAYQSLGRRLFADLYGLKRIFYTWWKSEPDRAELVRAVSQIVNISGNTITLDRPLRIDVRSYWEPQIFLYAPSVQEVGIENLTFKFKSINEDGTPRQYIMHQEPGYNAISFVKAANSWVRSVAVVDADNAINLEYYSRFITVDGVDIKSPNRIPDPNIGWTGGVKVSGHHALQVSVTQECLFTNFHFYTNYFHDLTVSNLAFGNVFMNGSGPAMNFDHHSGAPYDNLFTNISIGDPVHMWNSTGVDGRVKSGARETLWNIKTAQGNQFTQFIPQPYYWPKLNIVGNNNFDPGQNNFDVWSESLLSLYPVNLYTAQKVYRRHSPSPTPQISPVVQNTVSTQNTLQSYKKYTPQFRMER